MLDALRFIAAGMAIVFATLIALMAVMLALNRLLRVKPAPKGPAEGRPSPPAAKP